MWLHASSFAPWLDLFEAHGRPAIAPGWPGEPDTVVEARKPSAAADDVGLADLINYYADIARALPRRPVVVGHGFGGLVAEQLLARGAAWAVVSVEPAVARGRMPMSWPQLAAGSLFLHKPTNRSRSVWLTAAQFRLVFGTALRRETSAHLHRTLCVPSPVRPLFEAATAGLPGAPPVFPESPISLGSPESFRPHLVITGNADRVAPAELVRTNLPTTRANRTAVLRIPGYRHSLVVDPDWTDVAYAVLTWLNDVDPLIPTAPPPRSAELWKTPSWLASANSLLPSTNGANVFEFPRIAPSSS